MSSSSEECKLSEVTVVVIGDIGHSPRMCNHAYSFASHGIQVNIIGYLNSKPHQNICTHENIRFLPMIQPPKIMQSQNPFLRIIMLPLKFIWIFAFLTIKLMDMVECTRRDQNKKQLLLLQNPPGIPTMLVCYLIARVKNMQFAIDWHNYSYSMFRNKLIAKLLQFCEGYLGRLADLNICVSKEMKKDLQRRWGIDAIVLYDRPPSWIFRNFGTEEKQEFIRKFLSSDAISSAIIASNVFESVERAEDRPILMRNNRPLLLVSSTRLVFLIYFFIYNTQEYHTDYLSWTPDEDFSLLLDALVEYDDYLVTSRISENLVPLPKIFVVITGKGPQKEIYLEKIRNIHWEHVLILTTWLKAEEYPILLSSADVGVCLHTSTTGLDLPMKVVDMFGAKLPVLAKKFPALPELIETGVNGMTFESSHELARALIKISKNFPDNEHLKNLREKAGNHFLSWEENWKEIIWPMLLSNN